MINSRIFCLAYFNFGYCKLHFSSITLHVKAAWKSQYLFVVGAKSFPANWDIQCECFRCALQHSISLPVVYMQQLTVIYAIFTAITNRNQLIFRNLIPLWRHRHVLWFNSVKFLFVVTPYGDRDLGQNELRPWVVLLRHQSITRASVDSEWSSVAFTWDQFHSKCLSYFFKLLR